MSQNPEPTQSPEVDAGAETALPPAPEAVDAASTESLVAAAAEDESTIGTGTSMALGCIAGTVVLIIFGLLFLALSRLV